MVVYSVPGESPPPPPRIFYGRDELIEKIVGFAERLMPIALIGVGGIGKTSTALTVLHNDRIKQRFGDNRRFIRCDQFPASLAHFLRRLSKVIGSGVGNPEDLGSLRSFLSSKEMLIVLDNAESILDPQGTDAREIYAVVEEISQLSNISLCITSRISTIPPDCKWIKIPTLSMDAARSAFYRIYEHGGRSDLVNNILEQLDFHPLSITLLATIAHHNQWDTDRLAKEWDEHRTDMLQTEHNKSLAATIELSLSSPMFRELGPEARDLLGVIAFFPQGVDESNLDWLFPTISGRKNTFDKFCVLSLTYRSDGFITMLAPLRSYLSPKDPKSSLLLCMTRDHYFTRLSVATRPHKPGFEEARWIASEDVNVEHLLDVFTSIDANSRLVWDACANFMCHIYRHKPRLTMLGPKIEGLRDDHPSKHECLHQLSQSFKSVGNCAERKRILSYILKLYRERGDERQVARALRHLSDANRRMGLREEGEGLVKEALETYEKLGHTVRQAECLSDLAWSLCDDGQLDAAEEAASRAIDLLPEKHEHLACQCHRVLGKIYRSKGDKAKAIHHLEAALRIVSSLNSHREPFWIHRSLVELFSEEGKFDDAYAHIEHARLHAGNDAYYLAQATRLQAKFRYRQGDLEEAKIEALCAVDAFEKVGATKSAKDSERLLKQIERAIKKGESLEVALLSTRIDFPFR